MFGTSSCPKGGTISKHEHSNSEKNHFYIAKDLQRSRVSQYPFGKCQTRAVGEMKKVILGLLQGEGSDYHELESIDLRRFVND
jgi:hypothetical protein